MPFPDIGFSNPTITLAAEAADPANGVPSPLSAKTGQYKTLIDAGTWGEQATNRGSTASIRFIWDAVDDWRFRKALLGYSYVANVGGTNRLHRVTPLKRPRSRSFAYLRELKLVGLGRRSNPPVDKFTLGGAGHPNPALADVEIGGAYMDVDGWPTAEKHIYEASFGPLDFITVGTGNSAAWAGPGAEMGRYVKGRRDPRPRELRIPGSGYGIIYDSADPNFLGGATSAPIGTPILVTEIEYTYTWFQVPFGGIPEAQLKYNLNKVNSVVFDGYVFAPEPGPPAGFPVATMLFKGWKESDPYPGIDGRYYVDLTYVFGERGGIDTFGNQITWHKAPQANGKYCLVKRDSVTPTTRIYEEADHRYLFMVP